MQEKIVCFAGHRFDWHCIGVEDKLLQTIEELINKGYSIFYDGGYGAFDKKCAEIDFVVAEKKKQLSVLEDYKKSIIFEYVTGKKEVV